MRGSPRSQPMAGKWRCGSRLEAFDSQMLPYKIFTLRFGGAIPEKSFISFHPRRSTFVCLVGSANLVRSPELIIFLIQTPSRSFHHLQHHNLLRLPMCCSPLHLSMTP